MAVVINEKGRIRDPIPVDVNHGRMKVLFRVSQSAALVLTVILVFSPAITADSRLEGRRGMRVVRRRLWRSGARPRTAGDRRAMLALGRSYLQGLGAPQDYVLAHMWFNLAASRAIWRR